MIGGRGGKEEKLGEEKSDIFLLAGYLWCVCVCVCVVEIRCVESSRKSLHKNGELICSPPCCCPTVDVVVVLLVLLLCLMMMMMATVGNLDCGEGVGLEACPQSRC